MGCPNPEEPPNETITTYSVSMLRLGRHVSVWGALHVRRGRAEQHGLHDLLPGVAADNVPRECRPKDGRVSQPLLDEGSV
jgi:hypothetical protein